MLWIKLCYVKLLVTSNGRGKCTGGNWVCLEKLQDSNALEYLEVRELVCSGVLLPNSLAAQVLTVELSRVYLSGL